MKIKLASVPAAVLSLTLAPSLVFAGALDHLKSEARLTAPGLELPAPPREIRGVPANALRAGMGANASFTWTAEQAEALYASDLMETPTAERLLGGWGIIGLVTKEHPKNGEIWSTPDSGLGLDFFEAKHPLAQGLAATSVGENNRRAAMVKLQDKGGAKIKMEWTAYNGGAQDHVVDYDCFLAKKVYLLCKRTHNQKQSYVLHQKREAK